MLLLLLLLVWFGSGDGGINGDNDDDNDEDNAAAVVDLMLKDVRAPAEPSMHASRTRKCHTQAARARVCRARK